jgi:Asp-tRNA(Asn)/Glu-tRNA(Gln) amidotransferase A subunit family amidase
VPISRREVLAMAVGAAVLPPAFPGPMAARTDLRSADITPDTIREAEKLAGVEYTPAQREQLVATIAAQIAAVKSIRALPRPLDLQPALIFDPRLPGVSYPRQANRVVLAKGVPTPLPRADADIAFAPVVALSSWIKTRQLTSERLTEIYLERIGRIAPSLYCFITVAADRARAEAKAMDAALKAGTYRGPLHGIPYGLKDVFDSGGVLTTWGAEPYRHRVPERDSRIAEMLKDAGAVLLGKTATGALANGWEWFGGQCRNPWNRDEFAGGSSTGSGSATAAGLCGFAIGSDSLGSILNPADKCGVVGLRPTFGRVPTRGAMPLTPSLDRIGPLCRRVEDAALVLAAINGPDPTSRTSVDMGFRYDATIDVRKLTVGYSPKWFEQVGFGPGAQVPASEAHHRALAALRELGVRLVEVELPSLPYGALIRNLMVEAAAIFEELTLSGKDELLPTSGTGGWPNEWRQARLMSAVDYLQLERFRRQVMLEMHRIFGQVDALFGPTYGSFDLVLVTNYTGHPGMTLRAGLIESPTRPFVVPADPNGPKHTVTHNVAFHGQLYQEGKILALGKALEERLDVWRHRPPVG